MKRHNLAFVFAALLCVAPFAIAQEAPKAAPANAPVSIAGSWTLYYDFGCTGSYSNAGMTLNSNGTYSIPSQGLSGNWAVISGTSSATSAAAGTLMFDFSSAKTAYAGLLASKTVSGTISTFSGTNGCFTMVAAGGPHSVSENEAEQRAPDKPEDAAGQR